MEEEKNLRKSGVEYNISALDNIDFLPYIQKYRGCVFSDLVFEVEHDYDHTELTDNEHLEGYILNWLTHEELIDYLQKRYPNIFETAPITDYIIF